MSTLKEKLPKIPSPIREMIVENIKACPLGNIDGVNTCSAFVFLWAKYIPDPDFWEAIHDEIQLMK